MGTVPATEIFLALNEIELRDSIFQTLKKAEEHSFISFESITTEMFLRMDF